MKTGSYFCADPKSDRLLDTILTADTLRTQIFFNKKDISRYQI